MPETDPRSASVARGRGVAARLSLALALALAGVATPAESSELRVIAADPDLESVARELAEAAPSVVALASQRLGFEPPGRLTVIVARRPPETEGERRRLGLGPIPQWAAGVAQPALGRIVLFDEASRGYPHRDLAGVLAHEAAHVMLQASLPRGGRVPRWYSEGLAMVAEREVSLADALRLARITVVGDPQPFQSLSGAWPNDETLARAAYAQSFSFVAWSGEAAGPGAPARLAAGMRAGLPFDEAFESAYGAHPAVLAREWRRSLSWRYLTIPLIAAGAAINTAMGLLALLAFFAARRRRRRILEEWDLEERWQAEAEHRFRDPGVGRGSRDDWPPRA
jgi:hypothetical protein